MLSSIRHAERYWTRRNRTGNLGYVFVAFVVLFAAAASTPRRAPIPADEVTLRHKIYGNERFAVFLLDTAAGFTHLD